MLDKHNFTLLAEPWAITEEALESIFHLMRNDKTPDLVMAPSFGSDLKDIKLNIVNHMAIIPVTGSLYGFSYDRLREQVRAAINDFSVTAIVLKIKSPGGLVAGCKETADYIFTANKIKSIYAYADGTMCSAAYWIGSAVKEIAAPVTASIGSIGVRTLHMDWSKWNENTGIKFTHLAAGEYKALGNEDEPLSKKAKDYFQSRLDQLYSIFVDSVGKNLGVDTKQALSMADGKVFLAQEALEKGLINRIEQDFESYFSLILQKEKIMDLTTLKNDHPDLYSKVVDIGKAEANTQAKQKIKDAVADESQRVLGIAGAVMGEDQAAKLTKIVESGASIEMVNSLKDSFSADDPDQQETVDTTTRKTILENLETAHSDGLNLEQTHQTGKGTLDDQAKSFSDLVNV